MRLSAIAALAAALIADAAAAQAQWRKHTYEQDGFELELPGTPTVAPVPLSGEVRQRFLRATNYVLVGAATQYVVVATLMKETPNFQSGIDRSIAGLRCKATSSNRALASPHGPARQIFASGCIDGAHLAFVRYYQRDNWFYAILAVVKNPRANGADDALRFLNSFKLIGPR
jgi:hypothetical protein